MSASGLSPSGPRPPHPFPPSDPVLPEAFAPPGVLPVLGNATRAAQDNNLNLLRTLAAMAVLVSHAWPISGGPGRTEPLRDALGQSLGSLAVLVFFAISGFLVAGSFERRPRIGDFLAARALRILPGLAVCLTLTAFLLGPLVTALPAGYYLLRPEPYVFLLKDLTLFSLDYSLPGVFSDQPLPVVMGSIWTLRHEAACYALLALAGLAGLWRSRSRAAFALGGWAALWLGVTLADLQLPGMLDDLLRLSLPFAIGIAAWIWRDAVVLSLPLLAAAAGLAWLARGGPLAYPLLCLAIAYGALWLAYVPGGVLRRYNRLGDYSYGIYLYAFPLQGLAVWVFGPQGPVENILWSLPPTLLCAVLSWHLVEAPALRLRRRFGMRHGQQTTRLPRPQAAQPQVS